MTNGRIVLFSTLICLPAVGMVGVGAAYVAANVPRMIRNEPRRIGLAYRAVAEDLRENPAMATYVGARKPGWRKTGSVGGAAWGRHEKGATCEVWLQSSGDEWRSVEVESVRPTNYALIYYWFGSAVAMILLGLSAFAVVCFVRFMKERDDFLAATAHDLTTPLVGLRHFIGRDDDEARNLNERMIRLVGNIRDFLKLGGRRPPPAKVPFDLVAAYEAAYALFRADYRDVFDGEDIALELPAEGRLMAIGDETLAVQIIWNVLGNDLKYAAPYGRVSVRFSSGDGQVRLEFIDEGQGMTKGQMARAFDRYYRAKTVLASGKGGFGIGLCTSREFARAMGGDLTVRPNTPSGCIFTLTLLSAS